MKRKSGQVWIETVLYTLIGLALIGLTLTFVMPKINQSKERAIIDQTLESLSIFQQKIDSVIEGGQGNVRNIDLTIKRGDLYISPANEEVYILIEDFDRPYSEVGTSIEMGRLTIITEKNQKGYSERISFSYAGIADLSYSSEEIEKKFTPATIPYKFSIENKGDGDLDSFVEIEISEK